MDNKQQLHHHWVFLCHSQNSTLTKTTFSMIFLHQILRTQQYNSLLVIMSN